MLLFRSFCRKNDSTLINTSLFGFFVQIFFGINGVFQEPQYTIGDSFQNFHPNTKRFFVNLVKLVKVGEDKFIFGQVVMFALGSHIGLIEHKPTRLFVVVGEITIRHIDHFLRIKCVQAAFGRSYLICHHVVDIICTHWTTKAHILNLYWSRFQHENICSFTSGPPVKIEQNVNVFAVDKLSQRGGICFVWLNFVKLVTAPFNVLPVLAPVIWSQTEGDYVKFSSIVHFEHRLKKVSQGVICKIPRNIPQTYLWLLKRILVKKWAKTWLSHLTNACIEVKFGNWNPLRLQSQKCLFLFVLTVQSTYFVLLLGREIHHKNVKGVSTRQLSSINLFTDCCHKTGKVLFLIFPIATYYFGVD